MRNVATSIFYLKPFARIYEEHPILSFSLSSRLPRLLFIHTSISSAIFLDSLGPTTFSRFPRQHRVRSKFSQILPFLPLLFPPLANNIRQEIYLITSNTRVIPIRASNSRRLLHIYIQDVQEQRGFNGSKNSRLKSPSPVFVGINEKLTELEQSTSSNGLFQPLTK